MSPLRRTVVLSVGSILMAAACVHCLPEAAQAAQTTTFKPGPVLTAEARSEELCEAVPNRIFVHTKVGTECLAYFVTKGFETQRQAVFYFGGDAPMLATQPAFEASLQQNLNGMERLLQSWADRLHVRYVYVSRLGLQGSSGNHSERNRPRETLIFAMATSLLKARLGIDTIALAGQSRGSTIAASLLTMGQKDIQCAVLGSGAFELVNLEYDRAVKNGRKVTKAALGKVMYDPSAHIGSIEQNPARRIFVLGDPADTRTPIAQQSRFVDSLKAAGHHAVAIEVEAPDHHGASMYSVPTAGACLNNRPEQQIIRAVANAQPKKELRASALIPADGDPSAAARVIPASSAAHLRASVGPASRLSAH